MSLFERIGNFFSEKKEVPSKEPKEEASTEEKNRTEQPATQDSSPKQETKSEPVPKPEPESEPAQPTKSQHAPEKQDDKASGKSKESDEPKSIEGKEELLKVVRDMAVSLFDDERSYTGKKMVLWLDADGILFQNIYDTDQYRQRMMSMLVNECAVRFDSIAFALGTPAAELRCTPVGKSGKVFMQVLDSEPEKPKASKKAAISIFGNAGSLLKEEYVLSPEEMQKKRIPCYNIGAGQFPQIPTGYRENHIAIDDNPASPMMEKNKFVSRMHAHIGYSDTVGFYLQVERDGTRLMGKRTRIFRGEQKIEMDNPMVKEPLKEGDLIELGKAVWLLYRELDND